MFHCGQASLSSFALQSRYAGFSEPEVGIEPTTFGLQDRRSSRLSYSGGKLCLAAFKCQNSKSSKAKRLLL